MTNSYRFRARPLYPHFGDDTHNVFAQPASPQLNATTLGESFAGAVVRQLIENADGSYDAEVDLQRATHQDALNEIANVLVGAGFQVAEAEIIEWTTSWLEGAIAGALGGGAIGGAIGSAAGMFIGALIGTEVGAIGGTLQRKVVHVIDARMNYHCPGGWQLAVRPQESKASITPRIAH